MQTGATGTGLAGLIAGSQVPDGCAKLQSCCAAAPAISGKGSSACIVCKTKALKLVGGCLTQLMTALHVGVLRANWQLRQATARARFGQPLNQLRSIAPPAPPQALYGQGTELGLDIFRPPRQITDLPVPLKGAPSLLWIREHQPNPDLAKKLDNNDLSYYCRGERTAGTEKLAARKCAAKVLRMLDTGHAPAHCLLLNTERRRLAGTQTEPFPCHTLSRSVPQRVTLGRITAPNVVC